MTHQELIKIINHLKTTDLIDYEDIRYFPENYPFTAKEFITLHTWLEFTGKHDYITPDHPFQEKTALFSYKKQKFIWRMLLGQGKATQLLTLKKAGKMLEPKTLYSLKENKICPMKTTSKTKNGKTTLNLKIVLGEGFIKSTPAI